MSQSMVSDLRCLLTSEIGSIFVVLAVMGLGYVTAGWVKEQSRKRRDVVDEPEQMRRELEAFRREMQNRKKMEEPPKVEKEDVTVPSFMPPRHPLLSGGGRGSSASSDASTASSACGSEFAREGLETDDSAEDEEDEEDRAAEAAK